MDSLFANLPTLKFICNIKSNTCSSFRGIGELVQSIKTVENSSCFCWSVQAATTKYFKLGSLNNKNLVPARSVSREEHSLWVVDSHFLAVCVLTWPFPCKCGGEKVRGGKHSDISSYPGLNPNRKVGTLPAEVQQYHVLHFCFCSHTINVLCKINSVACFCALS